MIFCLKKNQVIFYWTCLLILNFHQHNSFKSPKTNFKCLSLFFLRHFIHSLWIASKFTKLLVLKALLISIFIHSSFLNKDHWYLHFIKKKLITNYLKSLFCEIKKAHRMVRVHEFYERINGTSYSFLVISKMVHQVNYSKCFESLFLVKNYSNLEPDFVFKDIEANFRICFLEKAKPYWNKVCVMNLQRREKVSNFEFTIILIAITNDTTLNIFNIK